jgi:hypothetical protein
MHHNETKGGVLILFLLQAFGLVIYYLFLQWMASCVSNLTNSTPFSETWKISGSILILKCRNLGESY